MQKHVDSPDTGSCKSAVMTYSPTSPPCPPYSIQVTTAGGSLASCCATRDSRSGWYPGLATCSLLWRITGASTIHDLQAHARPVSSSGGRGGGGAEGGARGRGRAGARARGAEEAWQSAASRMRRRWSSGGGDSMVDKGVIGTTAEN